MYLGKLRVMFCCGHIAVVLLCAQKFGLETFSNAAVSRSEAQKTNLEAGQPLERTWVCFPEMT